MIARSKPNDSAQRTGGSCIWHGIESSSPGSLRRDGSACAADRSLLMVHGRAFRLSSMAALAKASKASELGSGMSVSR